MPLTTSFPRRSGGRACRPARTATLVLSLAAALCSMPVRAELSLFPTRVVMERNQRAAQVELMNRGSTPETYRIVLVNRRMTLDGEILPVEAPSPDDRFADELLRYSPRQVTIPPGQSQTVRLLLRKPADLAAGEYRSHLQFDRVEDTSAATSVEAVGSAPAQGIGVVIRTLVGASIPVIVRHGATQVQVTVSELALERREGVPVPLLALQLKREGNRSVFGDLAVTFTPAGGRTIEVAKAGGVAVYVPNAARRARVPLELPQGQALADGVLRVSYRERAEAGGALLAEATLKLP